MLTADWWFAGILRNPNCLTYGWKWMFCPYFKIYFSLLGVGVLKISRSSWWWVMSSVLQMYEHVQLQLHQHRSETKHNPMRGINGGDDKWWAGFLILVPVPCLSGQQVFFRGISTCCYLWAFACLNKDFQQKRLWWNERTDVEECGINKWWRKRECWRERERNTRALLARSLILLTPSAVKVQTAWCSLTSQYLPSISAIMYLFFAYGIKYKDCSC